MLGKLLKYDIKAEFKSLLPMYIITLMMPIAIRIMDVLAANFSVLNTFYGLLLFMYVMVLIGIYVWTLVVAVKHFYASILKDEGYLTNTLPVKRSHIILSKEIVSLLTFIATTIIVIISLFIGIYHGGIKEFFDMISQLLSVNYDLDSLNMIFWFIIVMLISYVSQIQIFYLAMLLGQTRSTNKIMFSFVFGIIIYIVIQIIATLGIGIDYLIEPDLMSVYGSEAVTPATVSQIYDSVILLLSTTVVIDAICVVAIHYISVYLVNNKLNLE